MALLTCRHLSSYSAFTWQREREREYWRELWSLPSSYKDTNPIIEPHPHDLIWIQLSPKGPTSHYITLGVRVSTDKLFLWGAGCKGGIQAFTSLHLLCALGKVEELSLKDRYVWFQSLMTAVSPAPCCILPHLTAFAPKLTYFLCSIIRVSTLQPLALI